MHSPWIAVDLAADRVAWARLLRRAHEVALSGRGTPPVLREVIVRSWARCVEAGVDPDRPAPVVLDAEETASRFAEHPLAGVVSIVRGMLSSASADARHLITLSDADGMLLWAEGHPSMLDAAIGPRFLPGSSCSEAAVGTNAVGTALALDHAVQIFSAEHFNRLLHGWTCSAAPIHDPASGALLGAVDVSGSFRTAHPHTLSLVSAVARAAEAHLAHEHERRDADLRARYVERLSAAGRRPSALVARDGRILLDSPRGWLGPHLDLPAVEGNVMLPEGTRGTLEPLGDGAHIVWGVRPHEPRVPRRLLYIRALGGEPPVVLLDGRRLALSARHGELVVVLALHPAGLSADELARALHCSGAKTVTVRAEVARLRKTVGRLVAARPYRLAADVHSDFLEIERLLRCGDVDAAVDRYAGPLLPSSFAPAIVAARSRLETALRNAILEGGYPTLEQEDGRESGRWVAGSRRLAGPRGDVACARGEGAARRQSARSPS